MRQETEGRARIDVRDRAITGYVTSDASGKERRAPDNDEHTTGLCDDAA